MNIKTNQNSGVVLVAVICFTAVVAMLAIGLIAESGTHLKLAGKLADLEQAFYAAEAGTERAVSYIALGGTIPGTVTGVVGNGRYSASIISTGSSTNSGTNTVTGDININPNSSPDHEFLLMKPDGSWITRDDLTGDTTVYDSAPCVYYTGPAILIHVKPKGSGTHQYGLIINGTAYDLDNETTYDFSSFSMTVQVYNDSRNNGNGRANGKWWVGSIDGAGVTISEGGAPQGTENYSIFSIGTVNNVRRAVLLDGVHRQSWAKYAMWYDHSGGSIYFVGGEVLSGPVYSRVQVFLSGNPIFMSPLLCSAASWGQWSSAAVFQQGFQLGAPVQTMASVSFTNLLGVAGMVMTGLTSITLSQTNLVVSNPRRAWTNVVMSPPSNGVIYVRLATSGSSTAAIVNVGGTLDGRLTIVADQDIRITNHVHYAVHPTNGSDDALGLIAKRDVIIWTNAPANLDLYAHIIACSTRTNYNAGFYVTNYSTRAFSGNLNLYGGLVENNRGAVGLAGGAAGYYKNYIYDTRFATAPPPMYPVLTNDYVWTKWRDKGL